MRVCEGIEGFEGFEVFRVLLVNLFTVLSVPPRKWKFMLINLKLVCPYLFEVADFVNEI